MTANPILKELFLVNPDAQRRAKEFEYGAGQILSKTGEAINSVIFPCSGLLISNLNLTGGASIEVGLYGYQSVIGGSAAFGATTHISSCTVHVAGSGWAVPSEVVAETSTRRPSMRSLLIRHEQFMLFQAQQRAVCNASHSVDQRLATRLLRVRDVCGAAVLSLTQDQLADWLGVQRASVSVAAAKLKEANLISYMRGRIEITNEAGLLTQACECCGALR